MAFIASYDGAYTRLSFHSCITRRIASFEKRFLFKQNYSIVYNSHKKILKVLLRLFRESKHAEEELLAYES